MLILLPLLGFSQEGTEVQPAEVHHDDEKALEELQNQRDERQKALEALQKVGDAPAKGPTLTPEEQLKKLGFSGSGDPAALLNAEALTLIEKTLREAKMWEVPEEDIRRQIVDSFSGTPIGKFVAASPKLQSFLVDLMRDKSALLNGVKIMKDRARLKIYLYLYLWIAIMFSAYYLKRLFISKHWSRGGRMFASLLFSLTVSVITLSTFCLIFSDEMRPTIVLVKKHL